MMNMRSVPSGLPPGAPQARGRRGSSPMSRVCMISGLIHWRGRGGRARGSSRPRRPGTRRPDLCSRAKPRRRVRREGRVLSRPPRPVAPPHVPQPIAPMAGRRPTTVPPARTGQRCSSAGQPPPPQAVAIAEVLPLWAACRVPQLPRTAKHRGACLRRRLGCPRQLALQACRPQGQPRARVSRELHTLETIARTATSRCSESGCGRRGLQYIHQHGIFHLCWSPSPARIWWVHLVFPGAGHLSRVPA
mmetsp:Transcript_52833/g.139468  ORF Transcript_52833/g.139468 Transcript_52833/m.139468 type:complete len:247 (-) Transcript_52833:187-927(-)